MQYAARGWRVIPLHAVDVAGACTCPRGAACPSPGKHPIPKRWQDTPPLSGADIHATWEQYPYANVGVATGAPSGFFVLDIDPDGGGFDSMRQLVAKHGALPKTATQKTGSGGYHYLFALPDFPVRNKQRSASWLGGLPGIDVRGDGGQIVIAPSRTSKGYYTLTDRPLLPAPGWLLDELRPRESSPPAAPTVAAAPVDESDPAERARLDAYEKTIIERELARLAECREQGWDGPPWNRTTFEVACNLVELANSPWARLSHDAVDALMRDHAPRDERFGDAEIDKCVWSARQRTGGNGRPAPARRQPDAWLAGVPIVGAVVSRQQHEQSAPVSDAPAPLSTPVRRHTWDDLGNAARIVDHFGHVFRWVAQDKVWAAYDGRRWVHDAGQGVMAAIQAMMANLYLAEQHLYDDVTLVDKDGTPDPKGKTERAWFKSWTAGQRMAARVEAAEKMARTAPVLQARPTDFDAHPFLLNVANGIVDLRTGALMPHNPDLLLSQIAPVPYFPGAPAPRWEAFLAQVMPEPTMRAYLQRCSGYSITGDISEQAMFLHQGVGANGKSQYLIVMQAVLGDYNQIVPRTTLLAKTSDAVPTDIARMVGKRFMQTSETAHGKRLDEEVVKSLTGGEASVARHLYGKEFEFTPTGKIHYVTNHLPRLTDAESIWRRLHLFTWSVVIPEGQRVQNLGQLLAREEGPGILAWLVQGALGWQQGGLGRPDASKAALLAYRTDQDELGEFLDDYVQPTGGGRVTIDHIYRCYVQWASQSGLGNRVLTRQMLSMAMRERGYRPYRTGRERGFEGITVSLPLAPPVAGGLGI